MAHIPTPDEPSQEPGTGSSDSDSQEASPVGYGETPNARSREMIEVPDKPRRRPSGAPSPDPSASGSFGSGLLLGVGMGIMVIAFALLLPALATWAAAGGTLNDAVNAGMVALAGFGFMLVPLSLPVLVVVQTIMLTRKNRFIRGVATGLFILEAATVVLLAGSCVALLNTA